MASRLQTGGFLGRAPNFCTPQPSGAWSRTRVVVSQVAANDLLAMATPEDGDVIEALVADGGRDRLPEDRPGGEGWLAEAIAADLSEAERQTVVEPRAVLRRLAGF